MKLNLKVWKKLKTTFKWLLIIILLILLISIIKDFLDHYHLLVKKVTEQSNYIDMLQGEIHNVKEANAHLVNQLHIEHTKIEQLQQQLSVKINGQPVVMTVDDIKEEIEPQLKFPDTSFVPVAIIGVMAVLKGILFRFSF